MTRYPDNRVGGSGGGRGGFERDRSGPNMAKSQPTRRMEGGLVSKEVLEQIITDPQGTQVLVEKAREIGEHLAQLQLKRSQIRAIFGEVRAIEADWKQGEKARERARSRLILLKPKLAYRAARAGKGVESLRSVLEPAIDCIGEDDENFRRFVEFFEAILAYHRASGGTD